MEEKEPKTLLKTKRKSTRGKTLGYRKVAEVVNLDLKGLSTVQIHKATDVAIDTIAAIKDRFKDIFKGLDKVPDIDKIRGDVLKATHFRLLEAMQSEDKLDKANIYQLGLAADAIFKQMRLETNQSTGNIIRQTITRVTPTELE